MTDAARTRTRKVPITVSRLAAKHGITVERTTLGDYLIRDESGHLAEATRTGNPLVCHAKAMIRRYLAHVAVTRCPCWVAMRCLCAGHARGAHPSARCDTREARPSPARRAP